ncbi:MAG: hypothetical protein A2Y95_00390 [Deltaproteobacteria bacterium RBG_13_65_10]|nr:MAG: hypothetical protein A2Y95_00390 [Deltaproteobacteria bacterium RBG_13_65_10]
MSKRLDPSQIAEFIVQNISEHPKDIARLTSGQFGLSRQAINGQIKRLMEKGLLEATGRTKARVYRLRELVDFQNQLPVDEKFEEDVIWRELVLPKMNGVAKNVIDICQYGLTEMLNNVKDHSGAISVFIWIRRNATRVHMIVSDSGVGIFTKIQKALQLQDPRHALLELSKGKLTTDSTRHTGEGIFFTSRMFDRFSIMSASLWYSRLIEPGDQWLLEVEDRDNVNGTTIFMRINTNSARTTQQVFERYASEPEDYRFSTTHVPIQLAKYGDEQLVSRSQAKRVLARFERFKEVMLDFQRVQSIGQAFADEIFRVFKRANPDIRILHINASPEVEKMISWVSSNAPSPPSSQ